MLKWLEQFYLDEEISNAENIRSKLNEGKLVPGVYLLTLSNNPKHLMEVLPAISLKQRCVREICPEIFGMAGSKDAAIELSCEILKEVYDATGSFDIEDYLKNR